MIPNFEHNLYAATTRLSPTLLFLIIPVSYTHLIAGRDDVFIYGMRHVYLILVAICLIGACLTGGRLLLKAVGR